MTASYNYPRIVSLSTVGILKHYHQDYLLHPIRTDFVGSNGVGKSIIADLFQLLFITDRSLIEFGTDGLNKSLRKIETLPYKCSEAYVFINVEYHENRFITFGSCIPNKSVPIKQFLILNNYDTSLKIESLYYEKQKFLTYKDFLNTDGTIASFQELSRNLRNSKELYLNSYSYKEDKQDFYNWLFQQGVLPINLSIPENLKAFAKVIQSFSKAKTLKIEKSDSLKEFLFDDAEKENRRRFEELREELNRLLIEYHNLTEGIRDIEEKQAALIKLREAQFERDEDSLLYEKGYLLFLYREMITSKQEYAILNDKLKQAILERDELEIRMHDIDVLIEDNKKKFTNYDELLLYLGQYRLYAQEYNSLIERIADNNQKIEKEASKIENLKTLKSIKESELDVFSLVEIDNDIAVLESKKINSDPVLQKIVSYLPIYNKYGTAAAIETKYNEQSVFFDKYRRTLYNTIADYEKILSVIDIASPSSFFYWAINNNKTLNKSQQYILFHLIDVLTNKPDKVASNTRYSSSAEMLFHNYEDDITNNGLWLKLGLINEFVPYKSDDHIFSDTQDLRAALNYRKEQLEYELSMARERLTELDKIRRGENYDRTLIVEYDFDEMLSDHIRVSDTIQSESLIASRDEFIIENQQINEKFKAKIEERGGLLKNRDRLASEISLTITQIEERSELLDGLLKEINRFKTERAGAEANLISVKSKLTGFVLDDIEALIEEMSKKKVAVDLEREEQIKESGELIAKRSSISTIIGNLELECNEKTNTIKAIEAKFNERDEGFRKTFSEVIVDFEHDIIDANDLQNLSDRRVKSENRYALLFENVSDTFMETKNNQNQQVTDQLKEKTYSFRVLEEVLLGGKINHLDRITPYLSEANEQRINIAKTIYETMLKIFSNTKEQYENYEILVNDLNTFFAGKKISNAYYFNIAFEPRTKFNISWIDSLYNKGKNNSKIEELFYNKDVDVETFVVDFFRNEIKGIKTVNVGELLNPKNYFDLSVSLTDENKKSIPGSTGETYSAITLLGIARLSKVQNADRKGIRFMILEETASLDNTNFNTFPDIAAEFNYQLITMTPKPFGADSSHGWYVHHLIKGKQNKDVNYPIPASYFKTNSSRADLIAYLSTKEQ